MKIQRAFSLSLIDIHHEGKHPMIRCFYFICVCAICSCSNKNPGISENALKKEARHFFSNDKHEDTFVLQFVPSASFSGLPYTNIDLLSGFLTLSVYDVNHRTLYTHKWGVSDCFTMADNHYLSEDEKVQKFLNVVQHFFDHAHFARMPQLKITGVLKSSDLLLKEELEGDSTTVGFSFIQEDFCVMYARRSDRAILLRALKKDLLRKYNLL